MTLKTTQVFQNIACSLVEGFPKGKFQKYSFRLWFVSFPNVDRNDWHHFTLEDGAWGSGKQFIQSGGFPSLCNRFQHSHLHLCGHLLPLSICGLSKPISNSQLYSNLWWWAAKLNLTPPSQTNAIHITVSVKLPRESSFLLKVVIHANDKFIYHQVNRIQSPE